ncbi:beta/alpha barrel domain-containing protein [Sphingobacterium faecale]|uniref:Bifunctional 4-hydroxy-2-oxoglutarate aldolase/2-dehydro-3-deoxy-phosphogluconate aldolase n=1 Tax=Sphingobacterium faecale TaxID=2803775 RepID=A0ABS1R4D2_9SPHI|nr:bifunctional 4-hydroxy-2-oxoglutarate aldolase/2-dehydro-3-deoxy-phosphogluconate aldolase [Sphingobacterium faecale]MBL1409565.1 bifunctional 4-hydroxy-2-oxoglutarate aldolase/2-dehydro-3-deoxy-phosphogluconate aldolase [Sphingobacterium faecale]
MNKREIVLKAILQQGILPLFYHDDVAESVGLVKKLYKAGIRVFEFTNRGDKAAIVFKELLSVRDREMPGLYLGIGTIKNREEAALFADMGADFIVSPIINPSVAELVNEAGLLWIPGCMTPTEIYHAQEYEAALIKLFPANILGPGFMSAIRDLFKGQLFIPTGGVDIELSNLRSWFNSGVCAVGMGSKLIDPKNADGLEEKTVLALDLVKQARQK